MYLVPTDNRKPALAQQQKVNAFNLFEIMKLKPDKFYALFLQEFSFFRRPGHDNILYTKTKTGTYFTAGPCQCKRCNLNKAVNSYL